jgi:protein TonB
MTEKIFQDVVESPITFGNKRRFVVPLSILAHVVMVVAVFVVSLENSDALPVPPTMMAFFTTVSPPPTPPPPPAARSGPAPKRAPTATAADLNAAPLEAPKTIAPETDVQPVRVDSSIVNGTTGLPDGILDSRAALPPPPPPPPPPKRYRISDGVKPPVRIKDARPVYPAIAMTARVEGTVIIQTVIDQTGKVIEAMVLRSVPLLDAAALDAVRQWEYTPAMLNGTAVPVVMTVTVTFKLQ